MENLRILRDKLNSVLKEDTQVNEFIDPATIAGTTLIGTMGAIAADGMRHEFDMNKEDMPKGTKVVHVTKPEKFGVGVIVGVGPAGYSVKWTLPNGRKILRNHGATEVDYQE